jgi:hypothetical protein
MEQLLVSGSFNSRHLPSVNYTSAAPGLRSACVHTSDLAECCPVIPEYSRSSESSGRPFPGLLQLEKYFCTGVLESSGRPFPGLLQSVSAHVRSLQVLSCTTQVLAVQLFRELWRTASWNTPSSSPISAPVLQTALADLFLERSKQHPHLHQFFGELRYTAP